MIMKSTSENIYGHVDASPSKSFFVTMLTRDISLEDAILDLIDNCVDGIIRTSENTRSSRSKTPYKNYKAEIHFDSNTFSISDNCGGIPWRFHDYAFKMGRPADRKDENLPTVGAYGIGMKRAIFKMGFESLIQTQFKNENYEIEINKDWILGDTWGLIAKQSSDRMAEDGTIIIIEDLLPDVSDQFSKTTFSENLIKKIESHYARIISKGLEIKINNTSVEPKPIEFHFKIPSGKSSSITPYLFTSQVEGVDIFISVGIREPIPSQSEIEDEQSELRYSRDLAGWTVICNDRVVLYCNKDEETGWGEAGVPKYHNQFIAISGIVEFSSNDATKLPTTTTKRGIEHSSRLYAQVKNRMREGLKLFTDYTNDWKTLEKEAKLHLKQTPRLTFDEVKTASKKLKFREVRTGLPGKQYKPKLPEPKSDSSETRISFVRPTEELEIVSQYLFGDATTAPSKTGAECFDRVLKSAR